MLSKLKQLRFILITSLIFLSVKSSSTEEIIVKDKSLKRERDCENTNKKCSLAKLLATPLNKIGTGKIISKAIYCRDGEGTYNRSDIGTANFTTTLDDLKLDVGWYDNASNEKATIVLFHGNGMTRHAWEDTEMFDFFKKLNLNIATVTIRGYPGSEGTSVISPEQSILLDTEAIIRFVHKEKKIPLNKIMVFGVSLGGAYATTASLYFNLPLILHNAWSNITNIISDLSKIVPDCICSSLAESAFPSGNLHNENLCEYLDKGLFSQFKDNILKFTDGANNLNKLNLMQNQDVLIIFAENDELMGGIYRGVELFMSRYAKASTHQMKTRFASVKGGHCSFFTNNNLAKLKVENFINLNLLGAREIDIDSPSIADFGVKLDMNSHSFLARLNPLYSPKEFALVISLVILKNYLF